VALVSTATAKAGGIVGCPASSASPAGTSAASVLDQKAVSEKFANGSTSVRTISSESALRAAICCA